VISAANKAGRSIVLAILCSVPLVSANAQDYPSRPIRLVVPWPAGSGADIGTRPLGPAMSAKLGQPVVFENRAGAAGAIGLEHVRTSPPDGYTLAPVAAFATASNLWVVSTQKLPGVKSLNDLIAYAKANPGAVAAGSPGRKTSGHLLIELFSKRFAPLQHVPYQGTPAAITDAVGGRIGIVTSVSSAAVMPHVKAGTLVPLVVTGRKRMEVMPEVPSSFELGHAELDSDSFFGILMPPGTPPAMVQRIAAAIGDAVAQAEVRDRIRNIGYEAAFMDTSQFTERLVQEYTKWERVIKETGVKDE
jgi:tripartite-type tricarboxylate transporter receptor subunit TctC